MKSSHVESVKAGLTRKTKVRAAVALSCVSAAAAMVAFTFNVQAADEPGRAWMEAKEGAVFPAKVSYANEAGRVGVVNHSGDIQIDGHPFFEPLGEAGRACVTCHQPADAMSLSLATINARWEATKGEDPLFHR
jgi:hypothetical protein